MLGATLKASNHGKNEAEIHLISGHTYCIRMINRKTMLERGHPKFASSKLKNLFVKMRCPSMRIILTHSIK